MTEYREKILEDGTETCEHTIERDMLIDEDEHWRTTIERELHENLLIANEGYFGIPSDDETTEDELAWEAFKAMARSGGKETWDHDHLIWQSCEPEDKGREVDVDDADEEDKKDIGDEDTEDEEVESDSVSDEEEDDSASEDEDDDAGGHDEDEDDRGGLSVDEYNTSKRVTC